MLRDQDKKHGDDFSAAMDAAGMRELRSAYRCPCQNGYVERVIGTMRRECLDHVIIFNSGHLRRVLTEFVAYHNGSRTHLALAKDCPEERAIEASDQGRFVALPVFGDLHHRYTRRAESASELHVQRADRQQPHGESGLAHDLSDGKCRRG